MVSASRACELCCDCCCCCCLEGESEKGSEEEEDKGPKVEADEAGGEEENGPTGVGTASSCEEGAEAEAEEAAESINAAVRRSASNKFWYSHPNLNGELLSTGPSAEGFNPRA